MKNTSDNLLYLVLISIFVLTISSCGKKIEIIETKSFENTWGMDFKSELLDLEVNKDVVAAGKAVAIIENYNNTSASGFFISSDGLFLTNHHLVTKERCSDTRCHGFKIIRDFREHGDFEVFKDVTLLANDEKLDFAILKVTPNKGKPIPFLHLNLVKSDFIESQNYLILGHPFGGALRKSNAYIYDLLDENTASLKSVAISGNSGSPLYNPKTNEAEALYFGSDWEKESITKKGEVKHFGMATFFKGIFDYLSHAYEIKQTMEDGIQMKRKSQEKTNYSFEPLSSEEILAKSEDFASLAGVAETEQEVNLFLHKLLLNLQKELLKRPSIQNNTIFKYQRWLNIMIRKKILKHPLSAENIELMKSLIGTKEKPSYFYLLNNINEKNLSQCHQEIVEKEDVRINKLISYGQDCNSEITINGELVINLFSDSLDKYDEKDQLEFRGAFLKAIQNQLMISPQSIEESKKSVLLRFVSLLTTHNNNHTNSYDDDMTFENIRVKIINSRKL